MMEAVRTSETLIYFEPTQRNIPESYHLHTHHHENLKSHKGLTILTSLPKHNKTNYYPSDFAAKVQCTTLAFGDEPR
jgi:hypothetical protein